MPPPAGRPTLATVAASAGVSVATVSKVVNGRKDVAPRTRALVQGLLQEQNYVGRRADPAARGAGPHTIVEVAFAGLLNAYSTEVLHGIVDAGAAAGVTVAVSVHPRGGPDRYRVDGPSAWARDLARTGRLAVLTVVDELSEEEMAALARARLPLVVIDPYDVPSTRVTSVGSTNFAGGLAATEHLLSLGHRRIAYVGGPTAAACNRARLHGYRAAMDSRGAPVGDEYVRSGSLFSYEDGVAEGTALLDLPRPPTAIFAGSDETAAGVIEAARRRGARIPQDLSVVGFDDTKVAVLASPPLTTVRQPLREMGAVALRNALRLAAGERLDSHHVELATELVVRQSTGPPSAAATEDSGSGSLVVPPATSKE